MRMKYPRHAKWWGIAGILILGSLLVDKGMLFRSGLSSVIPPGVVTPTSLVITLDEINLEGSINSKFAKSMISEPVSLDVIKNTGKASSNVFATGTAVPTVHNGIRFILEGTGTYSGIDPCTGLDVTDATITLPDVTNNVLVERFQVPHPVTGLQAGARQIDPMPIGSSGVSYRLVFPASNSVGCVSDTSPSQVISGVDSQIHSPFGVFVDSANNEIFITNSDSSVNSVSVYGADDTGNISPQRVISGANTGLQSPSGIYVDTVNNEIEVANTGNDSITVYPRTWNASTLNLAPTRVISGAATGLRGPGGIYEFNDEIYVTNGPDDSITVYDRNWNPATPAPKRIIQGPTTGLNTPCGIYVDSSEIAVVNNGNNSITFYDQTADSANGNVYPLRTIKGDRTGISAACGIAVDAVHNEVAVANAGENDITFYSRSSGIQGDENVYPIRRISGVNAALSQPVGIYLDSVNDEIAVANLGNNSVTMNKRNDATPHLLYHPQFMNPVVQQQVLLSFVYRGTILRGTGQPQPPTNPNTGQPYETDPITNKPLTNIDPVTLQRLPVPLLQGYSYILKVTDPTLHAANDISSTYLIPPSTTQFHLADGSIKSNLLMSCPAFTPFIIDEVTTNCLSQALIISPFPPQPMDLLIAASVNHKVQNKHFSANIPPFRGPEYPLVLPRLTLSPTGAILEINWSYVTDDGQPFALPPLIMNQAFQITYNKAYNDINSCYGIRVNPNLAFTSGSLGPDARSKSDIKDTNCDIFMTDVDSISFSMTDAYENRYSYSWNVVD